MARSSIIPVDETARLSALARYRILDMPPDGAFDRITALVAQIFDAPIAIISLVDRDRIWSKSRHRLDAQQIDREPGLCASAILNNQPCLVSNARIDPRTLAHSLVAQEVGFQFYAAVPLHTHDGYNLGTLCCLDVKPRTFSDGQTRMLESLARIVMDQMELRLAARRVDELHQDLQQAHQALRHQDSHDAMTGIYNRSAITEQLARCLDQAQRAGQPVSVMGIDIDHFKRVNDAHGHPAGDQVLLAVATRIQAALRADDPLGRLGGEEFLCVLPRCSEAVARQIAERCRQAVASEPITLPEGTAIDVSISIGIAVSDADESASVPELVRRADRAFYRSKRGGRNRVTVDA